MRTEMERLSKMCDDWGATYLFTLKNTNLLASDAGRKRAAADTSVPADARGTPMLSTAPTPVAPDAPATPGLLSAAGATATPATPAPADIKPALGADEAGGADGDLLGDDYDDFTTGTRSKKRRGNLPKAATNLLKKWVFENLFHPYPSEEAKKQLADQCGLNVQQISNWFINARRRIVQPMLESICHKPTKKKGKRMDTDMDAAAASPATSQNAPHGGGGGSGIVLPLTSPMGFHSEAPVVSTTPLSANGNGNGAHKEDPDAVSVLRSNPISTSHEF
jgi:hypothetical protein